MIINEKIKASEVQLSDINGKDLGIVSTKEALRMAKALKVDLVCLSLTSSPPPCKLVPQAAYKNQLNQEKQKDRQSDKGRKIKEIRFSVSIEDHDYDTKKRQAERLLASGDTVQLTVQVEKKNSPESKNLMDRLIKDLNNCGKPQTAMQISGKQIVVIVHPI
jgi:translation initiation factor IF-3